MKKIFSEIGINGTYTGYVQVFLNYTKIELPYHNPSTHDTETVKLPISKVQIFINNDLIETIDDIRTEKDLIEKIKLAEKSLIEKLKFNANSKNINLLNKFLDENGYK